MGYQVLGTLGQGARSTVYSVKDNKDQLYALKRVVKSKPEDQRFVDQAITEHEVCVKLDHPSIRKSYKLLYQRQFLRVKEIYVVMELVDGTPLEDTRFTSMMDVCKICQQIATGLIHMHKVGFVHADMKPRNVLITSRNQVKIIDFGQSCRAGTVKERIQGTIDFIAPEQVKREEITPRTDVYNFGATMYWLLTGRFVPSAYSKQVVSSETTSAVSKRAEEPFKPPREYNPSVPPALSMLVVDCVRDSPADRPDSMQSVFDRLNFAIMQVSADAKLGDPAGMQRQSKKSDSADADLSDIEAELDKLANQNRREQRPSR